MPVCYIMYSPTDDSKPVDMLFMVGGPTLIQNHSVVCDVTTGQVYKTTSLVNNPADYNWPDAELLAIVNKDKLIWFENITGTEKSIDSQISRLKLSPEEETKVRQAFSDYYNPEAIRQRMVGFVRPIKPGLG